MFKTMHLNVLVVGVARSGVAAANLLNSFGASVTVTDMKDESQLKTFVNCLSEGIRLSLGGHPLHLLDNIDLIVVSPGVDPKISLIKEAQQRGIRIASEIEIAYEVLQRFKEGMPFVDFIFLGITGTNGKSTTTSLLYEIIKDSGYNAIEAGNIGRALSSEALNLVFSEYNEEPDIYFIVTELSSFQLEGIENFRLQGSALLNITPDHLDRYNSIEAYIDAKCRIFDNQTEEDFIILNADDPYTETILKKIQETHTNSMPEVFFFSRKAVVEGAYYLNERINFNIPRQRVKKMRVMVDAENLTFQLNPEGFLIKGLHNIENIMAASLMAVLSGCSKEVIESTLRSFKGLQHRLEFVRNINGIDFINDSKGTNVGAVAKSLEGYTKPVILIAGGRDKASDFTLLRPYVKDRVKALVLIGESAHKIANALKDLTPVYFAEDMSSAVQHAMELGRQDDTVLLSPACASFDMFRDYEDRGKKFKDIVHRL